MKFLACLIVGLLAITLLACGPPKPSSSITVEIHQANFVVDGRSYSTGAELTAALKALPSPDYVAIIQSGEGIPRARRQEAIAAIQNAGIKKPIATVGNEQFQ